MKGTLHLAAGIIAGVYTGISLHPASPEIAVNFAFGCMIGSVLPDIDSPKATICKWVPIIPMIISKIFGHRNLFHAPILPFLGLFVTGVFSFYWDPLIVDILYGIIAGYFLHLIQDSFTIGGIPVFYPFSDYKLRFTRARSGSFWNYPATALILFFWIFGCAVLLIQTI